jgi:hypothetical protein
MKWYFLFLVFLLQSHLLFCQTELPCHIQLNEQYVAQQGEVVYISCHIQNRMPYMLSQNISLQLPEGWFAAPSQIEVNIEAHDSCMQIFAIKTPPFVLAGRHTLLLEMKGMGQQQKTFSVIIQPKEDIKIFIKNSHDCYPQGEPFDATLVCSNAGNSLRRIHLEIAAEPLCKLSYFSQPFEIPANEQKEISIRVEPQVLEPKQYLFAKVIDEETQCQITSDVLSLDISCQSDYQNEDFNYLPTEISFAASGTKEKTVGAIEFAGYGLVDPERKRYLDFYFLFPTDYQHLYYGVEQSFFVELSEPDWTLTMGDAIYELSPLTQESRNGRGGGFEIYRDAVSFGAHYTQNVFTKYCNPKEICSFIELYPTSFWTVSGNYMHRDLKKCASSNTFTLESQYEPFTNHTIDIEIGRSFAKKAKYDNSFGYFLEAQGKCFTDTRYDIQKISTGKSFYGYYQNVNLFSAEIDFPINWRTRSNFYYSRLKQNPFNCRTQCYPHSAPRQRQLNANISYNLLNGAFLRFNGLLLRARDCKLRHGYNFKQKWIGCTYSKTFTPYCFYLSASFGQQRDYRRHHTTNFLQTYYACLDRQLTSKFSGSIFCDVGNTNYYDARQWRNLFGASLRYQYALRGSFEIGLQNTRDHPHGQNLWQTTCNLRYQFRNFCTLQAFGRYTHFQKHCPSNYLFFVALSIPLSLPISKRHDTGDVCGYVYDTWHDKTVSKALLTLDSKEALTDDEGRFLFPKVCKGQQQINLALLPDDLITSSLSPKFIEVQGGKKAQICIPVIPSGSVKGYIKANNSPMEAITIYIKHLENKEIYTCQSNNRGFFAFTKLRPGKWQFFVEAEQLPTLHILEEVVIDIQPKENKEIILNIQPQMRQILKFD